MRGVSEDGRDAPGLAIGIDEGGSLDAIVALPIDDEGGMVFFDVEVFGVSVSGHAGGEVTVGIEQPCVAGFGREQYQRTDSHKTTIVFGGSAPDVFDLLGQEEVPSR